MGFDEEDKLENEDLENSYYDSAYDTEDDLERLDNPYYDEDYDTTQDTDRLQNDFYDDNELLNATEPEEGNPAFGRTKVNGPIKNVKGVANSKLIAFLKSHPWILGGVAIFIFFIVIALLIFQMDFDLVGIGQPNPSYYPDTPSCGKVFLTWENPAYTEARQKSEVNYVPITDASLVDLEEEDQYGKRYIHKPYEYDTYISGIVWNDNDKALDIDNEIVYQAMAVVTRSKLLSELPDNCVVLKNYNEQASHFVELDGSEEKYNEIINAVSASRGMIMVRNGDIVPAEYDTFLYTKKREEEDENQSRVYYYHMGHRNKEETQRIHAAWVDDLEKLKGEVIPKEKINDWEIKEMTSLSLYGAKYYIEKINVKYNIYRILKYYFGQDIEFYTIDEDVIFSDSLLGTVTGDCFYWPIGSDEVTVENGVLFAKGDPVSVRITSPFGYRGSVAGVEDATLKHESIDIGAPQSGYPSGVINIVASADGVISESLGVCSQGNSKCGGGRGNYILIDHGNGVFTRYAHLHSLTVQKGQRVKKGQVIGKMGNTGASNGVHLDFQFIVNGEKVNPLNYVSTSQPRADFCGPHSSISGVTGSYTGASNSEFIEFIAQYAVEDMHSSGILASVTIAQAALESGWGKSTLTKNYNNFFGMKAGSSWNGPTVDLPTTECDSNGDCYRTIATWRVYNSPLDSIKDHSNLLHNKRYSGVVGEKDYYKALTIIKNGGYATDPSYVNKLSDIIISNNLTKYDQM